MRPVQGCVVGPGRASGGRTQAAPPLGTSVCLRPGWLHGTSSHLGKKFFLLGVNAFLPVLPDPSQSSCAGLHRVCGAGLQSHFVTQDKCPLDGTMSMLWAAGPGPRVSPHAANRIEEQPPEDAPRVQLGGALWGPAPKLCIRPQIGVSPQGNPRTKSVWPLSPPP